MKKKKITGAFFSILLFLATTSLTLSQTQNNWFLQNPTPTINDLDAVFFLEPNVGWAAGRLGTIVKTTDGGENWVSLYYDPTFDLTDIFFINYTHGWACGPFGVILRTTDGGYNWENTSTNIPEYFKRIYFTSPDNGIAMYVGGFYKTSDGGESWHRIPGSWLYLRDMHFSDSLNGVAAGPGVIRTTDGGETWNQTNLSSGTNLFCIFSLNDSVIWTGSHGGVIYRTVDAGNSWNSVTTTSPSALNSIKFINRYAGITVAGMSAGGDVLQTTDGGVTWQKITTGSSLSFNDIAMLSGETIILTGTAGRIYKTTNGGGTWEARHKIQITEDINSVSFTDQMNGWAVCQRGFILNTTDGGNRWTKQISGGMTHFKQVQFVNSNVGFILGLEWFAQRYSMILRTTDAGVTWDTVFNQNQVPLYNFHFRDPLNGVAVGWYSQIFKTTDGGNTWQDLSLTQYHDFYAVKFEDDRTGYASGYSGKIFKTTDGGLTWERLTVNAGGYLRSINILSQDTVIVAGGYFVSNTPIGIILKTTDGGQSWVKKVDSSSTIFNTSFFISPETGFAAGDSRDLYKTTDRGETWTKERLPYFSDFYTIFFSDPLTGWIGGAEGLLLKTTNGGVTFVEDEVQPAQNGISGYELYQNYPNPFNPVTNIRFSMPEPGKVRLKIFDISGALVETVSDEYFDVGNHTITFNASELSSGVYFYRLETGSYAKTMKFVLLK